MVRSSEETGEDTSQAGIQPRRGVFVFKIDLIGRTHDASAVFLLLYNFLKFLLDFSPGSLGEIRLRLLGTGNAFLRLLRDLNVGDGDEQDVFHHRIGYGFSQAADQAAGAGADPKASGTAHGSSNCSAQHGASQWRRRSPRLMRLRPPSGQFSPR